MEIYKNLSLEDLEGEEWRDVVGWEDSHEVSNLGRVKTKLRLQKWGDYYRTVRPKILSQGKKPNGYLSVHLSSNKLFKNAYVHRLVVEAFVRPMLPEEEVNHLDKVKINNNTNNLVICSRQENYDYSRQDILDAVIKPVHRYTLDGRFDKSYSSLSDAARDNGTVVSCIVYACKGGRNIAKDYRFRYEKCDSIDIPPKSHKVVLATKEPNIHIEFSSPLEASKYFGVKYNSIISACTKHKKCKGYTLKYK